MEFESPKMSPELMGAISKFAALDSERKRIEGVLATEREKFRSHEAALEGIRANLAASESELALSGGTPDQKLRKGFLDSREEAELIGARIEGVSARLTVVERDLDAARGQLGDTFEQWRAAESARSADRLADAMQPFIEALKREYGVAAGLNDKRMLVALRAFVLPNPRDPGRPLFHGSNLRAGRFRSDASASALADDVTSIRLKVAGMLGASTGQSEAAEMNEQEHIQ